MECVILRYPTQSDWVRCRALALNTMGLESDSAPTEEWKARILRAGHSPIRTLWFTIRLSIPYYVSVHLVRHKVGVEHYVSSQRNDRQGRYDRTKAPQDAMVTHVMEINAQALTQMCRMRLCNKADVATRSVVEMIRDAVLVTNPEFEGILAPMCERYGVCDEMRPCGRLR